MDNSIVYFQRNQYKYSEVQIESSIFVLTSVSSMSKPPKKHIAN